MLFASPRTLATEFHARRNELVTLCRSFASSYSVRAITWDILYVTFPLPPLVNNLSSDLNYNLFFCHNDCHGRNLFSTRVFFFSLQLIFAASECCTVKETIQTTLMSPKDRTEKKVEKKRRIIVLITGVKYAMVRFPSGSLEAEPNSCQFPNALRSRERARL